MSSKVIVSGFIQRIFIALIGLFFVANIANAQQKFPTDTLSIISKDNTYDFDIELALDDSHRQYGMMFRTELPEMNGMLFIYDNKKRISMWMKNTFIPLDIIFVDEAGKIMRIEKMAQPRSLSLIRSGGLAKAVLEVNGGLADKLGIDVGDELIYSTFGNATK
ncbi:DUF192 domain-containing protein [Pseudemcibacter aquimaris]|uniref:DUF192 domain-containing protein n=1 Tax=Pseudemcibacter aquimaris TaxID=2857064 RepID=UPI002010DC52|nr:DUF192 domain-containing protein [Pseudemcibacter aquimaris]MCC3860230.1 DUF192 domain-containing protein [Pseudemcibacter aquimaris]WDU57555.1 DUF192 domain-containing protein [Pseudemcibacter aquimaris]